MGNNDRKRYDKNNIYLTMRKGLKNYISYFKVKILFYCIGVMDQLYYVRAKRPDNILLTKDIFYSNDDLKEHTMDLAKPRHSDNALIPIILQIHGGAWVYGDKDSYYSYYGMRLSEYGFGVFTINYRLAPEASVDDQIQDLLQAIKYTKNHAKRYGLDEERIYLVGDSSGAYLVSLIGCIIGRQDRIAYNNLSFLKSVRGLGLNCGIYDINTFLGSDINFPCKKEIVCTVFGGDKKMDARDLAEYSVLDQMTSNFPPSFVMGTEADGIYMETKRIVSAMENKRITFDSCIYPKGLHLPHDFHLKHKYKESEDAMQRMVSFFKEL